MATITSNGTGNWHTGGTWVGGVKPGVADIAVIANTHIVTLDNVDTVIAATINTGGTLVVNYNLNTTQNTANSLDIQGTLLHNAGTITCGASATSVVIMRIGTAGKYNCLLASMSGNCVLYLNGSFSTTGNAEYEVNIMGSSYTHTRKHFPSANISNSLGGKKFIEKGTEKTAVVPLANDLAINDTSFTVPTPNGWVAGDNVWIGEFSNTNNKMTAYTISSVGATADGKTTYNIAGSIAVKAISAVDHKWGQYVVQRSYNVIVEHTFFKTVNTSNIVASDSIAMNTNGWTIDIQNVLFDHFGSSTSLSINDGSRTGGTFNVFNIVFEYTRQTAGTGTRSLGAFYTSGSGISSSNITGTPVLGNIVSIGYNYACNFSGQIRLETAKIGGIYGFFVPNAATPKIYMNQIAAVFTKIVLHGNSQSSDCGLYSGVNVHFSGIPALSDYMIEELVTVCGGNSSSGQILNYQYGPSNMTFPWVSNWGGKYLIGNVYSYFLNHAIALPSAENVEILGCANGVRSGQYKNVTVGQFNADGISVNSGPAFNEGTGPVVHKIQTLNTTGTFTGNKIVSNSGNVSFDLWVDNYNYTASHGILAPSFGPNYYDGQTSGQFQEFPIRHKFVKVKKMNGVDAGYCVSRSGIINLLTYSSITPHSLSTNGWVLDPTYRYLVDEPLLLALKVQCSAGSNTFTFKVAKSTAGFDGKIMFLSGAHVDIGSEDVGSVVTVDGSSMALYTGLDAGWISVDVTITTTSEKSIENLAVLIWDGASSGTVYMSPVSYTVGYYTGGPEFLVSSTGGGATSGINKINGIDLTQIKSFL